MTPDKEAGLLVLKYLGYVNSDMKQAKECATIVVDKILEVVQNLYFEGTVTYWQEVKNEIEKI